MLIPADLGADKLYVFLHIEEQAVQNVEILVGDESLRDYVRDIVTGLLTEMLGVPEHELDVDAMRMPDGWRYHTDFPYIQELVQWFTRWTRDKVYLVVEPAAPVHYESQPRQQGHVLEEAVA